MKTRIMLGTLIMAAVIGSSVGVGYAGGGGVGTAGGVAFFRCYEIENGASSRLQLSVADDFNDSLKVSIGMARRLCTPANADTFPVAGQFSLVDPKKVDQITCYDLPPSKPSNEVVTLLDPLVGSQTVLLGPPTSVCIQSLCTGATDPCAP